MNDVLARKSTRVEYAEFPGTAPAAANLVSNAAFASLDKRAFLIGGFSNGQSLSQVLEYDAINKMWNGNSVNALPFRRSDAAAVSIGNHTIVVFGGYDDYCCMADTLLFVMTPPPLEEQIPSIQVPQKETSKKDKDKDKTAVVLPDFKHVHWSVLPKHGPQPCARRLHSMCSMMKATGEHGNVYLFGGFDGTNRLNDLWEFNTETRLWLEMRVSGSVPRPRDGAALIADVLNNRLLLFGGYTSNRVSDMHVFDLESCIWYHQPLFNGPSPRFGCFGTMYSSYAFVGLGQDHYGPSNLIFQINTLDWTAKAVHFDGDELEPRINFSACSMDGGKRFIIAGGCNQVRYSNTVWDLAFEKVEPIITELKHVKGRK